MRCLKDSRSRAESSVLPSQVAVSEFRDEGDFICADDGDVCASDSDCCVGFCGSAGICGELASVPPMVKCSTLSWATRARVFSKGSGTSLPTIPEHSAS